MEDQNIYNTALLVMDMQSSILSMLEDASAIKANVAKAIASARAKKIPVVYVIVGFRPGLPELGTYSKNNMNTRAMLANTDIAQWMKIDAAVAPLPDEVTVVKRRISAFSGSDLEIVLRSQNIRHLVLTGISTSGVVLSTVREAADKDFRITVLADCCADRDPEVHQVLTGKVFPRQTDVTTVEEWCR